MISKSTSKAPPKSTAGNALRPQPEMPDVTTGLREALDALNAQWEAQLAQAKNGDKDKLTRPNVVALLAVIADHLAPALYQQHGDIDGHPVVSDHDAVAVLRRFIDALEDIDTRGWNDLFAPPPTDLVTSASLTIGELKQDRAILELAEVEHESGGHKSRASADTKFAATLEGNGFKFRDKKGARTVTPTQGKIKSLRDTDKKRPSTARKRVKAPP